MNSKHGFKTKAIVFFGMLMPLFGISQTKNLVSYNRVFPKVDKVLENFGPVKPVILKETLIVW